MIRTPADIIARVKQLDESLEWKIYENAPVNEPNQWILVSSETSRVVAHVRKHGMGWGTFGCRYSNNDAGYIFTNYEEAMKAAKYSAVKEILEEDLRRFSLQ